ncbi:serine hydrolase domain-containing protein [Kibdelosporangium phytohabitans]|uniref:Serine hydrolase n=1 Tax=Kibdelosporangium phytohabitans TaxID=860235 RepID=A0A0N7F2H2_9PSEU|nr:serine hydrolase domain-containing protein [Kibdelosporangium phytohabitans]ALG05823.1 serine hydrolase [Kibdelosporangium phytohabitans]MBE1466156.1 CubicO group peptidase (beta-lactamase class C family) [Kibdelosporangium phytohabitans]
MFRRTVLALTMAGVTAAGAVSAEAHGGDSGRFDRPKQGFAAPWTQLRDGTPEQAGLDRAPIEAALKQVDEWTRANPTSPPVAKPLMSGVVTLLAHEGVVVSRSASGYAVRYSDAAGTELPVDQRVPMRDDTIFDMASISKLFTSIAVMQLAEQGKVDVDAPVSRYLPEFGVNGKAGITVKQLLIHTSGLVAFIPLWSMYPDKAARIKGVMDIAPKYAPGSTYEYSDLNLITLGVLVERLTGSTLDNVVSKGITGPLGMTDTGYNPPASKLDRIAATEYQAAPARGIVRGQVHDENAWSLGGVSGHAGIFSTARDMAVLAQSLINGGIYAHKRILEQETVRAMLTDYTTNFPGNAHGLGFELDRRFYMGGLSGPATAGHTGYTGTTLVLDLQSRSIAILLSNRVHVSRSWGSINPAREALATGMAKALAVRPRHGRDAWYTGIGNLSTATLSTRELRTRSTTIRVTFDTFVDTEISDHLVLESSSDGVSWQAVDVTARGPGAPAGPAPHLSGAGHRTWWNVRAEVPTFDKIFLRWRFSTDRTLTGRGVLLDNIKITEGSRVLLDGEKQPTALVSHAWDRRIR